MCAYYVCMIMFVFLHVRMFIISNACFDFFTWLFPLSSPPESVFDEVSLPRICLIDSSSFAVSDSMFAMWEILPRKIIKFIYF